MERVLVLGRGGAGKSTFARQLSVDTWCIFDNTGSGAAAENALDLTALCGRAAAAL